MTTVMNVMGTMNRIPRLSTLFASVSPIKSSIGSDMTIARAKSLLSASMPPGPTRICARIPVKMPTNPSLMP